MCQGTTPVELVLLPLSSPPFPGRENLALPSVGKVGNYRSLMTRLPAGLPDVKVVTCVEWRGLGLAKPRFRVCEDAGVCMTARECDLL